MNLLEIFSLPGLFIFAYLLGSVPWGLVLTKMFASIDIRQAGSGNIGATNVMRLAGNRLAALTLAGDVLKGALPVWLAMKLTVPDHFWGEIYISLIALSAFSGHLYPVYTKFKSGGKGVATAAGCFLVISPFSCFVAVLVFVLFVCGSNRVSAGSLAAAAILPVAVWKATHSGILSGCAAVIALLIYLRHAGNIQRLLSGTEPAVWK